MPGSADAARPAAAWDRRPTTLALLVALGLALRLWNASTARVHDDELHYAEDAMWSVAPLDPATALSFLRRHPHEHLRLEPRTGQLRPWGRAESREIARLGHPCLLQYVAGLVVAVVRPASARAAAVVVRHVAAAADAATIALLPSLATALGGSAGAGLVAAALYAVYPPAVTYGSLAYLDPPLAPLLVLLLVRLLATACTGAGWLTLGVATGLLISTKQVGLIALVLVPMTVVAVRPRAVGGLATWALATLTVVAVFTDPLAYAEGLLHPSRPIGEFRFAPVSTFAENLALLARPASYYWLSFPRHGAPLAPLMARLHPVLTPAVQAAYAVALVAAAVRGAGFRLLVLAGPAALMLGSILPSDGLWRFHLLSPLICLGAALALAAPSRRGRVAVLALAGFAGTTALLPALPGADGQLDLGDLLRMNPQIPQRQGFHDPEHPLTIVLEPSATLSRRVWLRPGRYAVEVTSSAPAVVALDGRTVLPDGATRADVTVGGHIHPLTVEVPAGGTLQAIAVRPVD